MQGPDLKVGKTDIIDSEGTRIVTETTNEKTKDGKSIWTINQEFDYDNDGVMDGFTRTTKTYDNKNNLINEEVVEGSEEFVDKTNTQFIYESETNNLVKKITTEDYGNDDTIDRKSVTKYHYDEYGKLWRTEFDDGTTASVDYCDKDGNYVSKHYSDGVLERAYSRRENEIDTNNDGVNDIYTTTIEYDNNGDGTVDERKIEHTIWHELGSFDYTSITEYDDNADGKIDRTEISVSAGSKIYYKVTDEQVPEPVEDEQVPEPSGNEQAPSTDNEEKPGFLKKLFGEWNSQSTLEKIALLAGPAFGIPIIATKLVKKNK